MFTGIVTEIGAIANVRRDGGGAAIEVEAPATAKDLAVGDSVAVDGVCLTAVHVGEDRFTVEVVEETLARSTLGAKESGEAVDLERPVSAVGRFDGHLVQGHVDAAGEVVAVAPEGQSRRVRVTLPAHLGSYIVEKGSIAMDGVSLTITSVAAPEATEPWFEVVLIPHTLESTVLGGRGPGDQVNIEVDVMAKYLERWMEVRG